MSSASRPIPPEDLLAHASFLQHVARELVADAHAAADLAQDTWVVALEHPPARGASLGGWLAMVAKNLAHNARRSSRRRTERESRVARAEAVDGDERSLERLELQRALLDLLLALPDEQRTVLYLRFYEGRTPGAIANELGIPVETVKTRQARALAALRSRLDARSGGDRSRWMTALAPLAIPHASGITSSMTTAFGGVLMKKFAVAGVVALVALCAWWTFGRAGDGGTLDGGRLVALSELAGPPPVSPSGADGLATSTVTTQRASLVAPDRTTRGALDVRLSWSDGAPAANVGLVARCANDPAPRAEYVRAVTDEQGLAHFADLYAGKVTLRPDLRAPFDATVEAGATNSIAHTFPVGIDVRGRVVGPDGAVAPTASIWCDGEEVRNPQMRLAVRCATDGTFRLRDVVGGRMFGARAAGFRPSPCVRCADLVIGDAGVRTIELQLEAGGGRIRGRVLDADGAALARARVLAGPPNGYTLRLASDVRAVTPSPAAIETAVDGTFEILDDLPPGLQPIHAKARGFPVWDGKVEVVEGASTFVEIRLQRAARVEGQVLDFDGRPLAGVDVIAAKEDAGGYYRHDFPPVRVKSGEDGRFALDWIPPGQCELNAHDITRPEIGRAQNVIECTAGTTSTCELRMERGRAISGRVEDDAGTTLAGWHVRTQTVMNATPPRGATTNSDGTFAILNLGDEAFDLIVRAPDRGAPRARATNVPPGTTGVVLVVEDAHVALATVHGRLVDPDARSLADVSVTLWDAALTEGRFVTLDAQTGQFEHRTQPGRYRLTVHRGTRALFASALFEVKAEGATELGELVFAVPAIVEIELRPMPSDLLDRLGLKLTDLSLSLESTGVVSSENLVAIDGVWRSSEILPGTWEVTLSSARGLEGASEIGARIRKGLSLRGAEVEVTAGARARFPVIVEGSFEVELSIHGAHPDDIEIHARDGAGRLLAHHRMGGFKAPDGHVKTFIRLPLGRAVVSVRSADRIGQVDVDVDEARDVRPLAEIVLRKAP